MRFDFLKEKAIPVLIGAGVSLFLAKSGFLFILFMTPLGFLVYRYGKAAGWTGFLLVIIVNAVLLTITAARNDLPITLAKWDFLNFLILSLLFLWITAPLDAFSKKISGIARFISASIAGAFIFTILLFMAMAGESFRQYMEAWVNLLASGSNSSAVHSALLEGLTVETMIEGVKAILLRGGSLVICFFIFFINRQISAAFARMFSARVSGDKAKISISQSRLNTLSVFKVNPRIIWVLSFSLLLVVVTRNFALEIPEIVLWNILVFCAILYFAQGLGILQFFLTKPSTSNLVKLIAGILIIVIFFSPVVNAVLFGVLTLLGIAENWIPLRKPEQNGPPSTPEAGGGNV